MEPRKHVSLPIIRGRFSTSANSIKKFGPPAREASRREVRDGLERKLARDVLTTLCRRPARTVGSVGQFIPGMK